MSPALQADALTSEPPLRKSRCLIQIITKSKIQCCKEQYCIGTWNVRSMNQGKLEVVKGDRKGEHRHYRNQRTKMDWNG